jgi:HK97 gp10 family phage protein
MVATETTIIHIKKPGVSGVNRALNLTTRETRRELADEIVSNAQEAAPVRTGFLKSSIRSRPTATGGTEVHVGASYGVYVEYGTRFHHAQPFFFPAVRAAGLGMAEKTRRIFREQLILQPTTFSNR